MSSIDFNVKITGYEAKEWIRNILGDAEEGRIYDEEDFMTLLVKHKPVDFKAPRKSRASKVSSSDRSEAEYDCQLCDARVWNHVDKAAGDMRGLGGQCSRLKKRMSASASFTSGSLVSTMDSSATVTSMAPDLSMPTVMRLRNSLSGTMLNFLTNRLRRLRPGLLRAASASALTAVKPVTTRRLALY